MTCPSLTDQISQCHRELRELFVFHQEALLIAEFNEALKLFASYKVCHDLHKQFEDEYLFPVFAELPEQGRWPVSVYEKEHDKIGQWFSRLEQDLQNLAQLQLDKRQQRLNIIAMLDREKSFKGLIEHHEEREEDAMLPALDTHSDEQWREKVSAVFSEKWKGCLSEQKATVKAIIAGWEA